MVEIWLLEYTYSDFCYDKNATIKEEYSEILIYVPNLNMWLCKPYLNDDSLEEQKFTSIFWNDIGTKSKLTKIGTL